jgi:hypothetical protein
MPLFLEEHYLFTYRDLQWSNRQLCFLDFQLPHLNDSARSQEEVEETETQSIS